MPIVILFTNVKDEDIPNDLERRICEKVATMLERPVEDIATILKTGMRVCKGGVSTPYCLLQLYAFKGFDREKNPLYTKTLSELLKQNLTNMKGERIQIQYNIDDPGMCGVGS